MSDRFQYPPTPSRHIGCPPTPSRQFGYPPAPQPSLRCGTPVVTHLSGEPIRVTRDPPLRKVHWKPSEPYGPALDIPELYTVPDNRLLPLQGPPPVCGVYGEKEKDALPALLKKVEIPKHNKHAARAARRAQKIAKQQEEREREKTPDIDKFIRNACGEAPIPSFNGDTILPRIAKKTSRKPLNPQGEKDEATIRHGKKDRSSRGGKKERREKKKKASASTSAVRAPSPPPSASPDLVQMYKDIARIIGDYEEENDPAVSNAVNPRTKPESTATLQQSTYSGFKPKAPQKPPSASVANRSGNIRGRRYGVAVSTDCPRPRP